MKRGVPMCRQKETKIADVQRNRSQQQTDKVSNRHTDISILSSISVDERRISTKNERRSRKVDKASTVSKTTQRRAE